MKFTFSSRLLLSAALLVAMPGLASDYTLEIFGNANMDDRIDESDIAYLEDVINGNRVSTDLCDANYDGEINQEDIGQIKKIMANEESELVFIDSIDRVVTVMMPVERVALLNKYCAEAIQIFGVQDRVVGVETEAREYTYLPEVCSLPALGKAGDPDLEAIVSHSPDLLITWYSTNVPDLEKNLPKSIPIIDLSFTKPVNLPQEVKILGYIFGKADLADDYIENFHDKYVDLVESRVGELSEDERPKVYLECNAPYKTYGNTTGAHQMMVLAGGRNIFDDVGGIPIVDPEAIIDRDPEVIIRGAYTDAGYCVDNSSKISELRTEITNRSGFDKIQAVKSNETYIVDVNLHYGLDYPIGLIYFAKIIHPELFEDVDPKTVHQEFLTDVLGVDFDLSNHSVFVYPPLEEC
jgi:iron complex transport system substrate-binding protein